MNTGIHKLKKYKCRYIRGLSKALVSEINKADQIVTDFDAPGELGLPDMSVVHELVTVIFSIRQLDPTTCSVVTWFYIKALKSSSGMELTTKNWSRILLIAILLCEKYTEDTIIYNADWKTVCPFFDINTINELERTFLRSVNFNLYVPEDKYQTFKEELKYLSHDLIE
eukprot:TRINITY_DN2879_c0_g1_i1.p1 TRINITY_DN2879_c0_g1~~TRINITY_DN2879_c0_g1_i1.p1  ORF type:complete len:192 (+),score=10.96 TRINITY_DN2879_c0_g1_i1:72-578(+)